MELAKNDGANENKILKKVNELLQQLGYNNSYKRTCILEILFNSIIHIDATELQCKILKKYNVYVSLTTIYKQLSILEKINIVKSIKLQTNRKKVYEYNHVFKHSHLVCTVCKKIVEVDAKVINNLIKNLSNEKEFLVWEYNLNLYGHCKECISDNKISC